MSQSDSFDDDEICCVCGETVIMGIDKDWTCIDCGEICCGRCFVVVNDIDETVRCTNCHKDHGSDSDSDMKSEEVMVCNCCRRNIIQRDGKYICCFSCDELMCQDCTTKTESGNPICIECAKDKK